MYGNLYEIANREHLDMIMADYDRVWDDANGCRQCAYEETWKEFPHMYGRVVGPEELRTYYNANSLG